jgi:hypothetical protein
LSVSSPIKTPSIGDSQKKNQHFGIDSQRASVDAF